jgi:translation elongation factor EF-G
MRLEVTCGDVGAVVGDLGRRRAQVLGLELRGDDRVVRAELPLATSVGYAGALSALTHGRGWFVLEPGRDEPVPDGLSWPRPDTVRSPGRLVRPGGIFGRWHADLSRHRRERRWRYTRGRPCS